MSTDEKYNGWTNRETWLVALHINNDQGFQEMTHERLREAVGEVVVGDEGYEDKDVPLLDWEAGAIVRELVEEVTTGDGWNEHPPTGLALDLLNHAIACADWDELGASFLRDATEES